MSRPTCDGRDMCDRVRELEQERRDRMAQCIDQRARIAELEEHVAELEGWKVQHEAQSDND